MFDSTLDHFTQDHIVLNRLREFSRYGMAKEEHPEILQGWGDKRKGLTPNPHNNHYYQQKLLKKHSAASEQYSRNSIQTHLQHIAQRASLLLGGSSTTKVRNYVLDGRNYEAQRRRFYSRNLYQMDFESEQQGQEYDTNDISESNPHYRIKQFRSNALKKKMPPTNKRPLNHPVINIEHFGVDAPKPLPEKINPAPSTSPTKKNKKPKKQQYRAQTQAMEPDIRQQQWLSSLFVNSVEQRSCSSPTQLFASYKDRLPSRKTPNLSHKKQHKKSNSLSLPPLKEKPISLEDESAKEQLLKRIIKQSIQLFEKRNRRCR